MKKIASVAVLALGMLFSGAVGAAANTIVTTSPTAGQSLEAAPSAVTITTELPLLDTGNDVVVTDPSGIRVDDGTLTIAGTDAVVGLKNFVRSGIYTVTYTLLAENDLPLTGTFTFNFAEPTVIATVAPEPSQTAVPSGNNAGTTIFVLGLLLAALVVTVALARYARKLYSER
ncbi:MAG: copper resistance protein CopC [Candidatus Planktophila sp.]